MLQITNHRKGVTVCMNANNEVGERLGEADLVVFCRATKNRQNTFASSRESREPTFDTQQERTRGTKMTKTGMADGL